MKASGRMDILSSLRRFDAEISRPGLESAALAALGFVERELGRPYASLALYDRGTESVRILTRSGAGGGLSQDLRLEASAGIIGRSIRSGEPQCCADVSAGKAGGDALLQRLPEAIRAVVVQPLRVQDETVGTLNVGSDRRGGIPSALRGFLDAAAARLAAVLQNARRLEELQSACHRLQRECEVQKSALKDSRDRLEQEVARRTAEIRRLQERLQAENTFLREELASAQAHSGIIGESPALKTVMTRTGLVAPTDASVLIQGESGTGKELIAREIHRQSGRRGRPLVKVNCATIPRELYESEFFGHAKGAFTGAISDRVGRFEAADGGTLFLDEVGEIPLGLQGKLLRVLQEREFERVGEGRTRRVDVRIIAATNKNLSAEVAAGRFREDLYYRLNVFPIEIAPLRERKPDIPLLAAHYTRIFSERLNRPRAALTEADLAELTAHDWPGNVRELQNVIERALILSPEGRLDFGLSGTQGRKPHAAAAVAGPMAPRPAEILTEADFRAMQRQNTLAALERSGWKIYGSDGAARRLGVKPTTLIERMRRLEIRRPA
jgi:transcriptional regulator with GAF, ATPase, and Fis domain